MQIKDSKNLKANFVEMIKSKILSGELKPGDKLPPERELAAKVGISRGSVNQGILDLERMGFLRIAPRKGTFVAEYVKNATPETLSAIMSYDSALIDSTLFRDLMQMRILVERECTRLACQTLTHQSLTALQAKSDAIYAADDADDIADAVYRFHKCLVEISGNTAYAMVFQSFKKLLRKLINVHYTNRLELENSLPKYAALTDAIAKRDEKLADDLILSILNQALGYLNVYIKELSK